MDYLFFIKSKPMISLFGMGTIELGFLLYLYFMIKNKNSEKELKQKPVKI